MRKIKTTEGLSILLNHAGTDSEGLITANISIPIDAIKYLNGKNVIECIKENALPNVIASLDAITQEITPQTLELVRTWLITGTAGDATTNTGHPEFYYFLTEDDAMRGEFSLTAGDTKPTYAP